MPATSSNETCRRTELDGQLVVDPPYAGQLPCRVQRRLMVGERTDCPLDDDRLVIDPANHHLGHAGIMRPRARRPRTFAAPAITARTAGRHAAAVGRDDDRTTSGCPSEGGHQGSARGLTLIPAIAGIVLLALALATPSQADRWQQW